MTIKDLQKAKKISDAINIIRMILNTGSLSIGSAKSSLYTVEVLGSIKEKIINLLKTELIRLEEELKNL